MRRWSKLLPTKISTKPWTYTDLEAKRQAEKEQEAKEVKEAKEGASRLTGEGLEVLGCEVCGCPLRFKVCLNPACMHVNPREPEFIE